MVRWPFSTASGSSRIGLAQSEVSCHLLAVTPTAHWLEYVDWAEPIIIRKLTIENGEARIPDAPGTGVEWDEDAVRHYSVD